MNEVKRFKPVRIDAVSFAKRFKGRRVRYVRDFKDDGSLDVFIVTIVGHEYTPKGKAYVFAVTDENILYPCSPEWLIHSGNDFSR